MTIAQILLQYENLLNPQTITVTSLLIAYIYVLWGEKKDLKKEIKDNKLVYDTECKAIKEFHEKEINSLTTHYRSEIKILVDKNEVLQNERYQITREVIPLLIELIDKLDREKVLKNGK
jgi:hypothetical protein